MICIQNQHHQESGKPNNPVGTKISSKYEIRYETNMNYIKEIATMVVEMKMIWAATQVFADGSGLKQLVQKCVNIGMQEKFLKFA